MTQSTEVATRARWGLLDAALGLAVAIVLAATVTSIAVHVEFVNQIGLVALSYLATWIPLAGAVLVASQLHGTRSLLRDFGLRFRPIDLAWGIIVGLIVRLIALIVDLLIYGGNSVPLPDLSSGLGGSVGIIVVLAAVVVGPLVEETFFRGLLQRAVFRSALEGRRPPSTRVAAGAAIAVTATVFALIHLLGTASPPQALATGIETLVLGIAAGVLAALTGRLGGAVIAHAVFNGTIILLSLTAPGAGSGLGLR
jgi:membrane protease YdiL (CAAX protease family)